MPGPRTQAAMAHDSHAGVTVLFGGTDGAAGAYFGDTWLWDGASWAATSIAGMSPRYGCALVYDARKQETMAFGGRDASGYLSDQYVLPTTGRRGMAVVAPPQLGGQAQFRYLHPATAAGRVAILAVGGHETAEQQVPIPGLVSLGGPRFDVGALWAQFGFLSNAGGSVQLSLPVPADPALAGLAFDVQGLDLSLPDSVVYWASADAEVAVQAATPPVDLDMAAIPAGSVMMGSPIGNNNERPMHVAVLSQPFWMGRTEVTQAQYQAVMGSNPSAFQGPAYPGSERMPVETVSYQDALAYCASLTFTEAAAGRVPAGYQYRLPTEAEWEYCCRAGTTTEWHTGTSISFAFANYAGSLADAQNPNGRTWQVARYAPNAFGLHDMHGGLWEWCLDAWDGTPNYPSATVVDPYVTVGSSRVIRGGSWFSNINDFNIRSALRGSALSAVRNSRLGFRVVLAPALVP
jgi:formylglycine-generating enzyme required for sulfatase activity